MKRSPARRAFKKMLGQTNHFLITILVGLDGVSSGEVSVKDSFSTSWNPIDPARSASRGRDFALRASLAWSIDAVDTYLRLARREPTIMTPSVVKSYDGREGLAERVTSAASGSHADGEACTLLVASAVTWRNRLVHSLADNQLARDVEQDLLVQAEGIREAYQGLEIGNVVKKLTTDGVPEPTFKEVASIIRAAHKYVETLDGHYLASTDLDALFVDLLRTYVAKDQERRFANVWARDEATTRSKLAQLAQNWGFVADGETELRATPMISEVSDWSLREARNRLLGAEIEA